MTTIFIFPCDPLRPKRVDEHFMPQSMAAREAGYEVRTLNIEALTRDTGESILPWPPLDSEDFPSRLTAVYRGWMLTPVDYERFSNLLAAKNVLLRSSPESYARAHELPGWYDGLRDFTPKTVEIEHTSFDHIMRGLERLKANAVFVRDYSKSLKHDRDIAGYVPDTTDINAASRVIKKFEELRGEDLAGNVLLREFEHFVGNEIRSWWVNGELKLVTNHPDTPNEEVRVDVSGDWLPKGFSKSLKALNLPFVTADFVQNTDGKWRMVELGDGQVSDVPADANLEAFIKAISA